MKYHKLQPLNDQEKKYAEEHHGLVYHYLHKYGYSIEEYYDIAIFGYLKAVQLYHRREDLRNKFQFSTIGCLWMKSEIKDYFRAQNRQKRKSEETVISLDAKYFEREGLYNIIGGKSAEVDVLENLLLETVLDNLPDRQRKIAFLKIKGYSDKEICSMIEISSSTCYLEMKKIKVIVKELMFG
ncbi:sigma-70 family RNA polymerase sigma factor [Lacrimispora sp.]|uniref:sigma-70 family RNA polymerase sigma factor n=1 Tax=Lacrimispora sp. TaxID=2719234 RepID=UPI0028A64653|nr:sigma-70 family RNA polymerase sigma factor [Lacrimispora sp.]